MPNWKTDKKKSRVVDGKCAIVGCPRPSTINYYGNGLCDKHEAYYFDEEMPCIRLKDVLKIPVSDEERERAEQSRKDQRSWKRSQNGLEDWEKEIFNGN